MGHLRVIICEVDEDNNNKLTELANVDVYEQIGEEWSGNEAEMTTGRQVVNSLSRLASVFYKRDASLVQNG